MDRSRTATALLMLAFGTAAMAGDSSLHGYLDLRGVDAPQELSWTRGGLGKTRFGGEGVALRYGGGAVVGTTQLGPDWLASADLQIQSTGDPAASLVEAWVRYRPVSLNRWRWSVKAGEFFPPISLENTATGWTSPWTLTPSAINSWVGEELRTIGGEGLLEWRGDTQSLNGSLAVFAANDPTGTLLDDRGWSLSDLTSGIGTRLREPDSAVSDEGDPPPERYNPFQELDGRPGWYGHLGWRSIEYGELSLLRYDNQANPSTHIVENGHTVFGWHTRFWSLGARSDTGPVTWIAQAMDGATDLQPPGEPDLKTDFQSTFVLAAWNKGRWRPALRWDWFRTRGAAYEEGPVPGEHGMALTAALNWQARSWLRLTGEVLRVDSVRDPRGEIGLDPKSIDTQIQFSVRWLY